MVHKQFENYAHEGVLIHLAYWHFLHVCYPVKAQVTMPP